MALLVPLLSSMFFLVIAMGLNQVGSEPSMYWDKVLPNTPMPNVIKKLLPQAVVMKPVASRNVADGRVNFGRKGARDNTTPNSNGKFIEETKSNHPSAIPAQIFGYYDYGASKKPDASRNVVDDGVNSIEETKSNHPSAIPAQIFGYNDYGASKKPDASRNVVEDGVNSIEETKSNHPSAIPAQIFGYYDYGASKKLNASRNVVNDGVNFDRRGVEANTDPNFEPSIAIFFHRKELYPGKRFALMLVSVDGRSAKFIPRQEANTIPFSTSEFPSILSRYSISPGSGMATEMRDTLHMCEMPSVAGEVAQCATSLEAMVDFATTRLGTHDVVAMTMEGGDAYAAERRPYKVKAVRRVVEAGGKGAVSCHPQPYPYVVFSCHSTITTEVYSVELILEDDGATVVKVVAICHLDTSKWNPKHISFKALGVEPGKGAVCHFLPLGHIVWKTK